MTDRPILYLAPGLLCSPRLWQAQRPALEAHFEVRDLLYHAHDRYEAAVDAFLADAPERFMLAGFSAGGYLAQVLATHAPERVSRLALLSTRPDAEAEGGPEIRRALVAQAETGQAGFERVTRETLAPIYLTEARAHEAALVEPLVEMANEIGVAGFRNQQEAIIHRIECVSKLPRIACPTLVLSGARDGLTTPHDHAVIAERVPRAVRLLLPGVAHMVPLEAPATYRDILVAFFLGGA